MSKLVFRLIDWLRPGLELRRTITNLKERLEHLRQEVNAATATNEELPNDQIHLMQQQLETFAVALREIQGQQEHTREALDISTKTQEAALQQMRSVSNSMVRYERHHRMQICMEWLSHTPVQPGPLVSVIVPTRDRLPFLKRAIASLENQTYGLWEALIVNDGSTDETSAFLHSLQKPRFRSFESGARGPCAARNVGLQHATGQLIAYLDDDNIMHPNWLKSVVWAFQQRPEIDVLYGAFIIDDMRRIDSVGRGDLPSLFFLPYDPQGILEGNVADISCIAHRGGLSEAHFDESLREMGDWDLFIRLTREKPPLALPVVACFYTTEAPNRLTLGPTHQADFEKVKMKNRR